MTILGLGLSGIKYFLFLMTSGETTPLFPTIPCPLTTAHSAMKVTFSSDYLNNIHFKHLIGRIK